MGNGGGGELDGVPAVVVGDEDVDAVDDVDVAANSASSGGGPPGQAARSRASSGGGPS